MLFEVTLLHMPDDRIDAFNVPIFCLPGSNWRALFVSVREDMWASNLTRD